MSTDVQAGALPAAGDAELLAARETIRRHRTTGRVRALVVSLVLLGLSLGVFCLSISMGDFRIPLPDVLSAVVGHGNADSDFVVGQLRLPRALTGALVGAAFGTSGAIFQALARNPLASPDVIGITQGASTAAVAVILVHRGNYAAIPLGALAGGLLTAFAIYVLAYRRGVSPYRLVLVGIGVGATLSSITSYLLTRADLRDAEQATVWLAGSLNGRGWPQVRAVGAAVLALLPAAVALARPLRAMQLGDDTAKGLGVRVERARAGLVVVAVGLAAVATAAAGPVGFVAFLSAPIARRLVRAPLAVVPAALTGALLVLSADLLARRALAPIELPVGVVTGVLGAPYLLWLLARANRVGRGG